MLIAIRVDASVEMGTGHVVRCLTLAKALRVAGHECHFICRELEGDLVEHISREKFQVHLLRHQSASSCYSASTNDVAHAHWLNVPWHVDSADTAKVLKSLSVEWLIVDHYAIDINWENEVAGYVDHLLVIDDLADRQHECSILIDQNWFYDSTIGRYTGILNAGCTQLLGPSYAILQPAYSELRTLLPVRDGRVRRLLVFLGGSDPDNVTLKVVESLRLLHSESLVIDVVLGVNHPDPKSIRRLESEVVNLRVHVNLPSLAGYMFKADLMIGGGGSTTWERMSLGLPSIVIGIADNQFRTNEQLAASGYITYLGTAETLSVEEIHFAIDTALQNPRSLENQSLLCTRLVDGAGVNRIIKVMASESCSEHTLLESTNDARLTERVEQIHNRACEALKIVLLCDLDSWIEPHLVKLRAEFIEMGHQCEIQREISETATGDVCFCLSFSKLVPRAFRDRFKHTLVVHESALPEGRGWSPISWQILEGRSNLTFTLFEAEDEIDSGDIYLQEKISLDGTELNSEWRTLQGLVTNRLCKSWVEAYPEIVERATPQEGEPSFYPRRRREDSELDTKKSIAEQFNLLRIVDNDRYPAFFKLHDKEFKLLIKRYEDV